MGTDDSESLSADRLIDLSGRIVRWTQVAAAYLLVGLFAVGVVDIALRVVELALPGGQGSITRPQSIIGLLDGVLLLFVIHAGRTPREPFERQRRSKTSNPIERSSPTVGRKTRSPSSRPLFTRA